MPLFTCSIYLYVSFVWGGLRCEKEMYCLSVRSIKNYEHRIECREFHFLIAIISSSTLENNLLSGVGWWRLKSAMLPLCRLQKDIKIIAIVICLPFSLSSILWTDKWPFLSYRHFHRRQPRGILSCRDNLSAFPSLFSLESHSLQCSIKFYIWETF